jgi:hypothetical protein
MAEVLFITRDDIVRYTALNGNVDTDKFIQFIKIAQDVQIENYLGTKLVEKLKQLIEDNEVNDAGNEDYKFLLEGHVKWMLIYWAMYEYMPNAAYTIANKGVYKHSSENAENVEKNEVDYLREYYKTLADRYTSRFLDYIINNSALFPEYDANEPGDVYPNDNINYGGWIL